MQLHATNKVCITQQTDAGEGDIVSAYPSNGGLHMPEEQLCRLAQSLL